MNESIADRVANDARVELMDEFDQNFARKAFFDRPWDKRKFSYRRGTLMAATNRLRRSYRAITTGPSIRFYSDAPYASIHQKGGKIKVTPRMRRYFWAMYYQRKGQQTKTKTGKLSMSARNQQLNDEAEFYRNMALNKKGVITIPRRKVIGDHPKVKEVISRIAGKAVKEYADRCMAPIMKKKF